MQAPPVYSPSVRYHAGNAMIAMLDALVRALSQMVSPEFRAILWKAVAYALVLIVLIAVDVERLSAGLASVGEGMGGWGLGGQMHAALVVLAWILSVAAGIGIVIGSIFLIPAFTALVGSFFVDDIALAVERRYYPHEPA